MILRERVLPSTKIRKGEGKVTPFVLFPTENPYRGGIMTIPQANIGDQQVGRNIAKTGPKGTCAGRRSARSAARHSRSSVTSPKGINREERTAKQELGKGNDVGNGRNRAFVARKAGDDETEAHEHHQTDRRQQQHGQESGPAADEGKPEGVFYPAR